MSTASWRPPAPCRRAGLDALALRGTAVIVGAPAFGTEVGIDVNHMIGGRTVTGLTLGDSETQTLIPALFDLVTSGQMPLDQMIRHYPFEEIRQAVSDVTSGETIKPVLPPPIGRGPAIAFVDSDGAIRADDHGASGE